MKFFTNGKQNIYDTYRLETQDLNWKEYGID